MKSHHLAGLSWEELSRQVAEPSALIPAFPLSPHLQETLVLVSTHPVLRAEDAAGAMAP